MSKIQTERNVAIDLLRMIACYCVIVNHTIPMIFQSTTPDSVIWFIFLAIFLHPRLEFLFSL